LVLVLSAESEKMKFVLILLPYNYIGNVIIHEDHRKQRRGRLSAAAMLVIAPSLIAFFIFQRQFISSFMMSGIK
jgi:ABC-type glycerol-3-phosphate transport system permease component